MNKLESILQFLDSTFHPQDFPDYPNALNGLQVEGPSEVSRLGAAVDASEATIVQAREQGVDFLLVHHGLFWDGVGPLTGPRYRKVAALLEGRIALYSLHLPLDAHEIFGNCALLARSIGLQELARFYAFEGEDIGWWGTIETTRGELEKELARVMEGPVHIAPGGPETIQRVGVLTGGGAEAIGEAAAMGLDALITGEAAHHRYHEAMENGLNLFLAGHYATETFGVKALTQHLGEVFDLPWAFLHLPTGL